MTSARHRAVALAGLMALLPFACARDEDEQAPSNAPAMTPQEQARVAAGSDASAADASAPWVPGPPPDPGPASNACVLSGPPALGTEPVLVWSDEFDGADLDDAKWVVAEGYQGHGTILNVFERGALAVHDGSLRVTTRAAPEFPQHPYAAGRIGSHLRFVRTYGRIEIRARFPRAIGIWYALWARPWDGPFPEIDFEFLSRNTMQVYFVNHWAAPPLPADQRRIYAMRSDVDFTDFHVYSVDWKPGSLEWRLDGVLQMKSTAKGVPTTPVGWMINSWVGGWTGAPTAETPLPSTFEVDYVRMYRDEGLLADPMIRVVNAAAKYSARNERITIESANFDEACFHVRMYDGDKLVRTLSTYPWSFDLAFLSSGTHALRFVATDGVRSAEVSLPAEVY